MSDIERWSRLATRILAPNPGPMTLDGTNTYVIRAPGHLTTVVVDPGPNSVKHLDEIESVAPVALILLTHHHADHAESIGALSARTGAPVRAADPTMCIAAEPLRDEEEIDVAGIRIVVVATPGHTSDSVCFQLPDDGFTDSSTAVGSILTGDTILGRGTTVLTQKKRSLSDYLRSLDALSRLDNAQIVLPAHGPRLSDLRSVVRSYIAHRAERLEDIVSALAELGVPASRDPDLADAVASIVYPAASEDLRRAALMSTTSQLGYLSAIA